MQYLTRQSGIQASPFALSVLSVPSAQHDAMIAKELETITGTDKRLTADHAAEAQLAFYLQWTLMDAPEIHIFNSLRCEADGDAAQIDHLVLHPNGLVVIESKSVHAKVKINDRGNWLRLYQGRYQEMPPNFKTSFSVLL